MKFKNYNNQEVDLFQVVSDQKLKHGNNLKIHVGTDSATRGESIIYFTVVAFRHSNDGVHFIYSKETIPRLRHEGGKPDSFTRLWRECKLSMEVAQQLVDSSLVVKDDIIVELDYNNLINTISTPLVSATRGWVIGEGFKCLVKYKDNANKPDQWSEQIAVKAADHLCQ